MKHCYDSDGNLIDTWQEVVLSSQCDQAQCREAVLEIQRRARAMEMLSEQGHLPTDAAELDCRDLNRHADEVLHAYVKIDPGFWDWWEARVLKDQDRRDS